MGSCMVGIGFVGLTYGCVSVARLWFRTLVIRESIRKTMSDWRRDISWAESIRKCEGKSLYNLGKANVLVL